MRARVGIRRPVVKILKDLHTTIREFTRFERKTACAMNNYLQYLICSYTILMMIIILNDSARHSLRPQTNDYIDFLLG